MIEEMSGRSRCISKNNPEQGNWCFYQQDLVWNTNIMDAYEEE